MHFWELRVPASPETTEGLTNFLWERGALGVVEEESPGGVARLRAFYAPETSSAGLAEALVKYSKALARLGLAVAPGAPEVHPVLEEAWASAWQSSFPPHPVGDRLLVVPPWVEGSVDASSPLSDGRVRVVIEPGRAFGTGHHGSTESCLVLTERAITARPGGSVLDIGTGSGILAIAAVRLGAAEALAIDVDPDAIRATGENARRNRCADRIRIAPGGPESLDVEARFDLVLANLLGPSHLALRARYRHLVAAGGALVLGGMLADDDRPVREALSGEGFIEESRVVVDGWSALALRPG
jgi:ribosomal protein L11 methyltransferase